MMPPETNQRGAGGGVETPFLRACRQAAKLNCDDLLGVAIARGCAHYAPLWPRLVPENLEWLPHEALGCALLRGQADTETFQPIRCGAMVLSDLGNAPELIAAAAEHLGVSGRVAHIARLGIQEDAHPSYWKKLQRCLRDLPAKEEDFLPGVSRLMAETRASGAGRGPVRTWLRTDWSR